MTTMTNATSPQAAWQDETLLWQHRALCGIAMPLRTPRGGQWAREVDGVGAAMGSGDAPAVGKAMPLPAGSGLRLLLLHVFTAALRGTGGTAMLGPDAASVATSLGVEVTPRRVKELEEQAARLLASRLRVTDAKDGTPMSVLDARGRRAEQPEWRPLVRLNARFFDSLGRNAVALDRHVVAALAGSATALDAYAWLMASKTDAVDARPVLIPWQSLWDRFGHGAASRASFETSFADSLAEVRELCPALRFTAREDGVELNSAAPTDGTATAGPVSVAASLAAESPNAAPAARAPDETQSVDRPVQAVPSTPAPPLADVTAEPVREPTETPAIVPAAPARLPAMPAPPVRMDRPQPQRAPFRPREQEGGRIGLAPKHTGLPLTVWLRRGCGEPGITIEVTPGADYHPARRSLLVVEPMVMQVAGQLHQRELDQIAAWAMANADLIQDYWDGSVAPDAGLPDRIRCVSPAPRW